MTRGCVPCSKTLGELVDVSLPDPAITNVDTVRHRTQLLEDPPWNPLVGVVIVTDHHRSSNKEVTELDMFESTGGSGDSHGPSQEFQQRGHGA